MAEKLLQCRVCGRVRLNGQWVYAELPAEVLGWCKTCSDIAARRAEIRARRAARAVSEKYSKPMAERGEEPDADPFKGLDKGE